MQNMVNKGTRALNILITSFQEERRVLFLFDDVLVVTKPKLKDTKKERRRTKSAGATPLPMTFNNSTLVYNYRVRKVLPLYAILAVSQEDDGTNPPMYPLL